MSEISEPNPSSPVPGASSTSAVSGRNTDTSHTNSPFRDRVVSRVGRLLAAQPRMLWYAETLVIAGRFLQYLKGSQWARESQFMLDRYALWSRLAVPRLRSGRRAVLEFGVADGKATRWWAAQDVPFSRWHGFDTFEGLPSSWQRAGVTVMESRAFQPKQGGGSVPEVEAPYPVEWHAGLIEDTLAGFPRPPGPLFVLIDVDLLEPTRAVLGWLAANGQPGDLVYFDEAFDPWNEGLAIQEAVAAGLRMRALGHSGIALLAELTA